jgi:uncharacterized protein (DUF1330 family)
MGKGYWVAFADVSDPEKYKAYIAENARRSESMASASLRAEGRLRPQKGRPAPGRL